MVEEVNGVEVIKPEISGIFISLQFNEEICFKSSEELLVWIIQDKDKFRMFLAENIKDVSGQDISNSFPLYIKSMISKYLEWYEVLLKLASEINNLDGIVERANLNIGIEEKKENFIHTCAKFFQDGFFPMQGSIGMCALAMSRVPVDLAKEDASQLPILPQSIAWLYAMSVLRKRQSRQEETAADVRLCVEAGRDQLNTLLKDIEEAQNKVVNYRNELDEFQKNALKSAALKSPANSLGKLERGHLVAALGLFALASVIVAAWATFIIKYYFPTVVTPLLKTPAWVPYETGAMVLTSVVLSGIVLTAVIILLRLAVARINFSVAAGERKAMAMAFRALLLQHAISDDQQMLFLQNIVGSKLPDYVNCNDIRIPIEELAKLAQAVPKGKKD